MDRRDLRIGVVEKIADQRSAGVDAQCGAIVEIELEGTADVEGEAAEVGEMGVLAAAPGLVLVDEAGPHLCEQAPVL